MKNQYFGDIGDYGKYGLLRFLAQNGVKIAVNWYLTANDGSGDGKHVSYLEKQDWRDRKCDPELFDLLNEMVSSGNRDILSFEEKDMIPGAKYYHEPLDYSGIKSAKEKKAFREKWHSNAIQVCSGAELVFLDPDNGLALQEKTAPTAGLKYTFAEEIADYYRAGQNVVYYCHRGRRSWDEWEQYKKTMSEILSDAKLCAVTFCRGTRRSYVFVLHEEFADRFGLMIRQFIQTRWSRMFVPERIEGYNLLMPKKSEEFKVTLKNGEVMTLWTEDEEDVCVKFSGSNYLLKLKADYFASYFRH